MTPKPAVSVKSWVMFRYVIFYIQWLYQTQGLYIICPTDTDVVKNILVK